MRAIWTYSLLVAVFGSLLITDRELAAFSTPTHRVINREAASRSTVNQFLTQELDFPQGLQTAVKGQPILEWIGIGGIAEDQWLGSENLFGLARSTRHFHHPLRPWDQAGLRGVFQSSVRWAQNPAQSPGRRASWHDAGDSFFAALTATSEQTREEMFAETFQTLGQLMHLVADVAVPNHTRDDIHLLYSFESFMAKRSDLITGFIGFDSSILQQATGDSEATIPIARIWDTNTYNGTNPPGDADRQIGLAEFTNANFFSEETIQREAFADPEYPLPGINTLVTGPIEVLPTGRRRQYLSKLGDGVLVTHMVAEGLFARYTPSLLDIVPALGYKLDDLVYQDYAAYLLPRAIGYSAGLLDYFFRGKIKIDAPDRYAYALAAYEPSNAGAFSKMRLKVSNETDYPNTTEDTAGPGQMWAVVRYRTSSSDLFEDPSADLSEPVYAVSAPISVTLGRTPQEVTFDFSQSPIPTNSADVSLLVVYQGTLGLEDGAIMVGRKDLFEPDPLTFGNATDYDCYQATLYHDADLTAFPPYNPPTQTQRDVDNNGIQDVFGPFINYDDLIQTFDISKPLPTPSATEFNFQVLTHEATLKGPQYSRFVLLQDRSTYRFAWLHGSSFDVPRGVTLPGSLSAFSRAGIVNDVVVDPATGQRTRRVTPNFEYRGVTTFAITITVVGGPQRFGPCLPASYSLEPSFIRIEGELALE